MSNKCLLLASVAAAGMALSGAANAQSEIFGGGGTSPQPYYLTVFAILNSESPAATFGTSASDPTLGYAPIGAGAGRTQFETNYPNTSKGGIAAGDDVSYGTSDQYLTTSGVANTSEVTNWDDGWTTTSSQVPASTAIPAMLPVDGPLIQIPMLGTSVTIPYDITNEDKTAVKNPIELQDSDLCGIFSGKITNWSQTAYFSAQKAGKYAFAPLTVVYRTDSSGQTFLLTQHFVAVCNSSNSNFNFATGGLTAPVSTWSAALFTGDAIPSNFVGVVGANGMADYLTTGAATGVGPGAPADATGYVSPDYTSIAPNSGFATSLPVATLLNPTTNKYYEPSITNTALALANPGSGVKHAGAPSTKAEAETQQDWVPSVPTPSKGYSIVGYSNILFAQCYADNNVATELLTFLTDQFNGTFATQIANAGYTTDPSTFVTAIQKDFITNTSKYGLDIQDPKYCKSATGASPSAPYVGR